MSKSRTRLFLENFFVYGLGSIISKVIPLIMLPIITSIMSDSKYYGINDMVNLVVSFASAIALMGMYDAMFRLFFENENEDYKKSICSTALFFVITSSVLICLTLILLKNQMMMMVINSTEYNYLFFIIILNIFSSGFLTIVSGPTRMENKRKIFLLTNTLAPILAYGISIPMLLNGEFIYALPLASVISTLIMGLIFYILNRKWFSIKLISLKYLKDMLKIGIPLMPTFVMLWLCSSLDRIMIKSIIGLNDLGIYSVASKIAQISQFIYSAVAMGWQYFAFSTMKDDDQKELITLAIDYILAVSTIMTILVTTFSKEIFVLLAKNSYVNGYILLPYLFFSPLLLLVFQIISSQFVIKKKTYPIPFALILAILINLGLNYLLIPVIGIEGAAISTMIGYLVSIIVILGVCIKMNLINKSGRLCILIIVISAYFIFWRMFLVKNIYESISITVFIIGIFFFMYKKEIKIIANKIRSK